MYAIWIRVDETLPWIELKGTCQTRMEAEKAAEDFLSSVRMEIVEIPTKGKLMKALVPIER